MILIGAPVFKRSWILRYWFEAIENQTYPLNDIGFTFEAGPDDEETLEVLFDWHANHPEVSLFDVTVNMAETHSSHAESDNPDYIHRRTWSHGDYVKMANLRNSLLQRVRCFAPRKYFSLDTDVILENPNTIEKLDALNFDAVSPLMYMSPPSKQSKGMSHPSVMTWASFGGHAFRQDNYPLGSVFQADIIMAAKMMSESVYKTVDYSFHPLGEDLGWSANCARAGFELYCASNLYAVHVMSQAHLGIYLNAGDSRRNLVF